MYAGQPLKLSLLLPHWISVDDFYLLMTGAAAFACVFAVGASFRKSDGKTLARIKAIQARRKGLQSDLTGPKKRKKQETSVNFIRAFVMRFQLLKSSQIGKTEQELIQAGFRSKDAIYVLTFFNLILPIIGCA